MSWQKLLDVTKQRFSKIVNRNVHCHENFYLLEVWQNAIEWASLSHLSPFDNLYKLHCVIKGPFNLI